MALDLSVDHVAEGFEVLGHTDQGGRPNGGQIMVYDGYAYVGQDDGFLVLDVRDPRQMKPIAHVDPGWGELTWSPHLQVHGDLLILVEELHFYRAWGLDHSYYLGSIPDVHHSMFGEPNKDFGSGLHFYDISDRANPRSIGRFAIDHGCGVHRVWYDGGRYAYASAFLDGYTDHIFMAVDVGDPAHAHEVGRWWIPGMWKGGGEQPTWTNRVALHHPVVKDEIAYCGWRDGGMTILDVNDPSKPELVAHTNWCPPFGGGTHNCLALRDRDLVIVTDEAILDNCEDGVKYTWVIDVRAPHNPVTIATLPTPAERDYCRLPGHFGPHNLHENRVGSWQDSSTVFVTYQNAGLRAFDISNQFRPEQTGSFVPPPPRKMVASMREDREPSVHSCDVFVTSEGIAFVTDYNCGTYSLQYTG